MILMRKAHAGKTCYPIQPMKAITEGVVLIFVFSFHFTANSVVCQCLCYLPKGDVLKYRPQSHGGGVT